MLFGLKNTGAVYCHLAAEIMNRLGLDSVLEIIRNLDLDSVVSYLDNILIHNRDGGAP